jgi:hypothetical protein
MAHSNHFRNIVFTLLKGAMIVAGSYHTVGLFHKVNDASVTRHALFIGLDLFCAYGFFKRPRYFVLLFGIFTIQQIYSHGQQLIQRWTDHHQIHWISVAVLVIFPLGIAALIGDALRSTVDGVLTNPDAQ